MTDGLEQLRFPEEAPEIGAVALHAGGEKLERDALPVRRLGLVDDAHAARADLAPDAVARERLAERHGRRGRPVVAERPAARPAGEEERHLRAQLGLCERLRDVVARAAREALEDEVLASLRREHDDRHRRAGGARADRVDHLEARHGGHLEIGDHEVRRLGHERAERLDGVLKRPDVVPRLAQRAREEVEDRRVVVDRDDPRRAHAAPGVHRVRHASSRPPEFQEPRKPGSNASSACPRGGPPHARSISRLRQGSQTAAESAAAESTSRGAQGGEDAVFRCAPS